MLLAESQHHAAPRGHSRARSGGWERDVLHGQVPEHPTPQAAGTQYYPMDVDDLPAAGGSRPDRLTEVRPQERVQRRTVEQIILAPMLDVPVPLMEEQLLVDAFAPHDVRVPEQIVEVPKIFIDELLVRTPVRESQLAEQLVEVPTIISFSSLQRIVEQNVDVPVPRGGVHDLQGFPPGQASTTSSFSLERISERNVEQITVSRVGEGLQDFLPRQSSSSSSHDPARASDALDAPGYGVFRTFHHGKKCGVPGRSVRTCPGTSAHGHRQLLTCLWALRRRRTSCLPYRSSSGRRSSGPGFKSSLAPLPSRGGERGRGG